MVQDNDAQVKTAFNTLLTYVKNVATKPDEEKFRKIRLSNATFQVILFFFSTCAHVIVNCSFLYFVEPIRTFSPQHVSGTDHVAFFKPGGYVYLVRSIVV